MVRKSTYTYFDFNFTNTYYFADTLVTPYNMFITNLQLKSKVIIELASYIINRPLRRLLFRPRNKMKLENRCSRFECILGQLSKNV